MKRLILSIPLVIMATGCGWLISCRKVPACFDAALKQQFNTISCTQDCPGVTGCDGMIYGNACIANSKGIRVVEYFRVAGQLVPQISVWPVYPDVSNNRTTSQFKQGQSRPLASL